MSIFFGTPSIFILESDVKHMKLENALKRSKNKCQQYFFLFFFLNIHITPVYTSLKNIWMRNAYELLNSIITKDSIYKNDHEM